MKKNILLLISFILGILYMLYSIFYWTSAATTNLSGGLAATIVFPHLLVTLIAVIFNGLAWFSSKRTFALTGAILYSVACVLFPPYFMFVIIEAILSYIGFAKLPKKQIAQAI